MLVRKGRTGVSIICRDAYSLALTSGPGALASLFSVTFPVTGPSPKKMTSTVKSSLRVVSLDAQKQLDEHTYIS